MDCMIIKEKGIMRSFFEGGGGGGDSRMLMKKEEEIQGLKIALRHVVKRNEMLEKKVRHLERKLAAAEADEKSRSDDKSSHTTMDESKSDMLKESEDLFHFLDSENVEDPHDIREEAMRDMVKRAAARALESTHSFAQIMWSRIVSNCRKKKKKKKKKGGNATYGHDHDHHMKYLEAVVGRKGCEIRWAGEEHKLALSVRAYVGKKMFSGYEHEDFYMSGRLRSLLEPEEHRRECWQQYRAMAARREPEVEPLSWLRGTGTGTGTAMTEPGNSEFGRFCRKKYVELEMDDDDDDDDDDDVTGEHTRVDGALYTAFVRMAYWVWASHRLSFASCGPRRPCIFWVEPGTEFSAASMEPAVPGLELAPDAHTPTLVPTVAFPVSPGFRLGTGTGTGPCLLPCSVYLDAMQQPSSPL